MRHITFFNLLNVISSNPATTASIKFGPKIQFLWEDWGNHMLDWRDCEYQSTTSTRDLLILIVHRYQRQSVVHLFKKNIYIFTNSMLLNFNVNGCHTKLICAKQ